MSQILFENNATTTIAGTITNVATTVNLTPGAGALFPAPTAGQYFVATFTDAATGLLNEIVHVTNMTGDVATIVRAQEGTTAIVWNSGDVFANLVTAGALASFNQTLAYYATDTGAANAYAAAIPSLVTNTEGFPFYVKITHTNTTASTFSLNGLAAKDIVGPSAAPIAANTLVVGSIYTFIYDGTNYQVLEANSLEAATGGGGGGALLAVNNLSDVANVATSRANLVVPTRTGGDASGTWAINVTGNSATSTLATTATTANALNGANSYSAVNFTSTSDDRLKDRGEDFVGALAKLDGITVFRFGWNDKARDIGIKDVREHIGVSAQDLLTADPALVSVAENEFLGVNHADTLAFLIACIKELRAEVAELRSKQ